MPNVDVVDGMALGVGIDLGGQIFGDGVQRSTPEVVGGGQSSDIFLTLVESQDDLTRALNLSTEISAAFGVFGGSAKFDLSQSLHFHQYSITLVIRATVLNAFAQMRDVQFTPKAQALIHDGRIPEFRTQFGDYFIRGRRMGGELCAILQIIGRDEQDQSDVKGTLQAGGILGSVSVNTNDSFSSLVKSATSRRETKFKHIQVGGDQIASIDPPELVAHALSFTASVRDNNSELFSALAVPYSTLDSPDRPNYIDITAAKDNVEIIMRSRRDALTRLTDFQFVAGHPDQFIIPPDVDVNAVIGQFETAVAKLTSAASLCVNHPSQAQDALVSVAGIHLPLDSLPVRRSFSPGIARGTWTTKSSMAVGRIPGLAAASNGKLYAVGGGTSAGPTAVVEEFDPEMNQWSPKASMLTARDAEVAAAGNGKIYAMGGNTISGELATVDEYDPASDTWTTKSPMPTARFAFGLASAANGKLYAVGGNALHTVGVGVVEEYDPSMDTWATRATMPTARVGLALAAATNGKLYAVGGYFGGSVLATVEEYDPGSNTWTTKAPMPTARYDLGLAAAMNGKIYAVGGQDNAFHRTMFAMVEEYDPKTDTWATKSPMKNPRLGPGVSTATNGNIYAVGGQFLENFNVTNLSVTEEYLP